MFTTLITFIIILGILVFVHELGHFWTAKKLGLTPKEFGFGFPPRIFGMQKIKGVQRSLREQSEDIEISADAEGVRESVSVSSVTETQNFSRWRMVTGAAALEREGEEITEAGTIYSLNWLPLGGFVNIGEDEEAGNDPRHFKNQKPWKRVVILSAGVAMNLAVAAVFITWGFMLGLPQTLDEVPAGAHIRERHVQILQVLPGSPAEQAGLQMGDVIASIDGRTFTSEAGVQDYVAGKAGETLTYDIRRGSEEMKIPITLTKLASTGEAGAGIAIAETGIVSLPWYRAIWEGIKATVIMTWFIITAFVALLYKLLAGAGVSADIAGPVGIAVMTGQVARLGFVYLLQFAAMLSINLAIINFLPFPALDGGRVVFVIIEKIRGRAVSEKLETALHNIGFVLLILLVLGVTYRDVLRFWN